MCFKIKYCINYIQPHGQHLPPTHNEKLLFHACYDSLFRFKERNVKDV